MFLPLFDYYLQVWYFRRKFSKFYAFSSCCAFALNMYSGGSFSHYVVSQSPACLFSRVGVFINVWAFVYIRSSNSRNAILTAKMANSLTGHLEQLIRWLQDMSKLFWRNAQNVSEFSPLRSVGFCVRVGRAGSWGANTAACSSRERPQRSRPAAPRGQGGRGCQGRRRPWPRTKDLGETFWGIGWLWRKWRHVDDWNF